MAGQPSSAASKEAGAVSGRSSWAGFHPFRPHPVARSCIELRVGRLLTAVRDREAYRALGYARLGDYASERLGLSPRTAQELMRTSVALGKLPRVAEAFAREEITSGHVRLLTRVADSESDAFWVRLARTMSVKELGRALAQASAGADAEGMERSRPEAESSGLRAEGSRPPADVMDPAASAGLEAISAASVGSQTVPAGVEFEEEKPLERVVISAPAWIAAFWRSTVTLVRRLSGGRVAAGECLEVVLAEAAAGRTGRESPLRALEEDALGADAEGAQRTTQGRRVGRLTLAEDITIGSAGYPREAVSDADLQASACRAGREAVAARADVRSPDGGLKAHELHPSARPAAGKSFITDSSNLLTETFEVQPSARVGVCGFGAELNASANSGERDARETDEAYVSVPGAAAVAPDMHPSALGAWPPLVTDSSNRRSDAHELHPSALGAWPPLVTNSSNPPSDALDLQPSAHAEGVPEPQDDLLTDPLALDAELRRLLTSRHRHDETLASHLRLVARDRGYRDEGFPSLEAYAFERFGLSPRNLYYLLALGKTLEGSRDLRNLFLSGALTTRQTILVGSVAARTKLDPWVTRARAVSLRRLDEEISFYQHLEESRPEVWDTLDGRPIPEGLVLVPGEPPRLHASARSRQADSRAEEFLRALEADETNTPLPARMTVIKMWVEPGVRQMWIDTLASLRATAGAPLRDWEGLAILMKEFWMVWDNAETRRQRRMQPVLERDGWRCTAPGCAAMGAARLEDHHIRYRSAGGSDDLSNRTTVCRAHHKLIHEGRVRVRGRAPDALIWELGVAPGREPFLVYTNERRIGGSAE